MQPTQNGHRFPLRTHRRDPLDLAYADQVRMKEIVALQCDLMRLNVRDLSRPPLLDEGMEAEALSLYEAMRRFQQRVGFPPHRQRTEDEDDDD
jgi:hypothetical protein